MSPNFKFYILFCLIAINNIIVNGQPDSIRKASYKSWVITYTKPIKHIGILYDFNDSTLFLLKSNPASIKKGNAKFESFSVESICKIRLRKKFNVEKGMLIGGLAGLLVGTVTNLALKNNGFGNQYIVGNTVYLTVMGVSIGAIIGSMKIKIPIDGNDDTYKKYRVKLNRYKKTTRN